MSQEALAAVKGSLCPDYSGWVSGPEEGKGGAGRVEAGGIDEVEEGGEGDRNNQSPPGQESCLRVTGPEGQACGAGGGQWFSTFFHPTHMRHTAYFHQ